MDKEKAVSVSIVSRNLGHTQFVPRLPETPF